MSPFRRFVTELSRVPRLHGKMSAPEWMRTLQEEKR